MKIDTDEDGTLIIKEVFSGAYIETSEGNRIGFCLRDDTIEFNVLPSGCKAALWYRIDMHTRKVEPMRETKKVVQLPVTGGSPRQA